MTTQLDAKTDRQEPPAKALPLTAQTLASKESPHAKHGYVQVTFFIMAIAALAVLWSVTFRLIDNEVASARVNAINAVSTLGLTYEAQVVRAIREIDQSLNILKRGYEIGSNKATLTLVEDWGLLLPDFLFVTSITDTNGNITSSTRGFEKTNIADQSYFQEQLEFDHLAVSSPWQAPYNKAWKLTFSRRINTPSGAFAGIAFTSVDASYFVSGYEVSQLGQHGALGILGTDGIFRTRRSGETIISGELADYAHLVPDSDEVEDQGVRLLTNSWDQVKRYTIATKLYDIPLVVILGLSEKEQLAASAQLRQLYLQRAVGASIIILMLAAVMFYLSRQLQQSRQRIMDEQITHAQQVEHLAYHDSLTGLPNRSLFSELLRQGIAESKRYDRRFALLFLDLDRFKIINDTLGHDVGDKLLIEVAKRLNDALRETDTVARLGGDEFVVLLPEMNDEKQLSEVARKILSAVGEPFRLSGQDLCITVSIGISAFPLDGEDEQTLVKNADIAMYHAKEGGKNNFSFYSEELSADSLERLALESSLRLALEREEFTLFYQEKYNLSSNEVTGAEALLRWQHPTLGLVLPIQFLPLAEETGLIVPIGKWVIETACRQAIDWLEQGLPPRCISVNLTARQFSDAHLPGDIASILQTTGLNPTQLELEISENLLLSDFDKNIEVLTRIKALGVRIAIDNFGTSYTSLSTLEQFQFDSLKIDSSVIRDVAKEPENRHLTEAIISVGRAIAVTIVAEGVETQEQADFLLASSCDQVQGFYYDKPSSIKKPQSMPFPGKNYLPSGLVSNINLGNKVCDASKAVNIARPVRNPK